LLQSVQQIRDACSAAPDIAAAYELIVCDNNSADTTAAVAEQAGCRVVFEPVNQISRARNRGASVASGKWLLFIDADSWPSRELIGDVAALLKDETCIGCGSTIRVIDGPRWFKFVWERRDQSAPPFVFVTAVAGRFPVYVRALSAAVSNPALGRSSRVLGNYSPARCVGNWWASTLHLPCEWMDARCNALGDAGPDSR
jgi:glycosyltransferase involved in cell wall biosynthesis